ncbi:hypothetical protein [Heliophilum fasciatum]|uniref:Uncharacterized protein n=1 Tax=Heliophilum fasciatum TaxID=35700 RepID=A0A4R2RLA7_9FIRM|nr:hypothetical protein [Heliophilum fasciatum]MCW2279409.1 hypothetical protein [Heliophilum fasciatum]TCP59995.1 hypothetical protein EDD73_1438 [Heliophilum fasciatum]
MKNLKQLLKLGLVSCGMLILLPAVAFAAGEGDKNNDTTPISGYGQLNGYVPSTILLDDKDKTEYYVPMESWSRLSEAMYQNGIFQFCSFDLYILAFLLFNPRRVSLKFRRIVYGIQVAIT